MRILPARFSPGCLGIVAACAFAIVLAWVFTLERLHYERQEAVEGAMRENGNLALAFEEHTMRTLKGLDRLVRFLRHEYLLRGEALDAKYLAGEGELDLSALATAGLVNERGEVIISMTGGRGMSVADREYFLYHRDYPDDALRIGTPVVGRVVGREVIHLTRRMNRADGTFAGVAVVGVDPQYFARFYSEVDLDPRGSIVLAGLDGRVRARRTGMALTAGVDLAGSPLFARLGEMPVGSYVGEGQLDGIKRYLSYRKLRDFPLVVVVGAAQDEVLAEFAERRRGYLTGASLATLFIVMSGALLLAARRRQRAELAAKLAAEARYRATFDQSAAGISHCAPDGRFLCANDEYCRMIGYTEAELRQRTFHDIVHPEDRGMAETLRAHFVAGDSHSHAIEHREVRKDGRVRWMSVAVSMVRDAAGAPEYFIAMVRDVSERKQAEEELRDSEARFRSLTELSSDFYWETDAEHRMIRRGRGGRRGRVEVFETGGYLGRRRWEIPHLSPDEAGWQAHRQALDARIPFRGFEISRRGDDGTERFISLSGDPVFDAAGNFKGYRGVGSDITDQKRAENARLEAMRRAAAQAYALGTVSSSDALAAGDVEQVARLVTELAAGATGVGRANVWLFNEAETELRCVDLFEAGVRRHSAGARLTESQFANEFRALKSARCVNADDPLTDPRTAGYVDSYLKPLGITSMLDAMVQISGRHLGLLCLEHVGPAHHWTEDEISFACQLADKIALAITNRERRIAEARYRATFDQSATGIAHASLDGRFLSVNRRFCRMLGYEERELVGRSVDEVTHPEDRHTTLAAARHLAYATQDSFVPEYEKRYLCKDGSAVWVSISVCVVRDSHGVPEYFIALANDISSRKHAEEKLFHRAHYDALTDLPNRVLCFDRLSQAIAQAGRKRWAAGVLFMDLDRFKTVNDTLGHASGDAVLRLAAQRLQSCVRAGDTVARVGGDEFVVVMAELKSPQDGAVVAQKIVDVMAKPLRIDGQEVYIGTSIGIATFPADGRDGETLVKNADAAMLRAKQVGRNNYQFYTAAMNERALEKLQLETDLRRALERREFFLHYQPKVSLASGRITGAEALLRWNRPGHGAVSPAQFVPILEDCGLIVPVGDWIVDTACAQVRSWRDAGLDPVPVAVNLAAKQFLHHDIGAVIDAALARYGIPGSLLQIEITESDAMASPEQVSVILGGLKQRGVTVAIDDFGTGYSSLGYLKRFPLDTLKLDRSFVTGLPEDTDDVSIALAVIGMAHSLGLKVVAEGVENAEQRDFLSAHGCDEMQGYLFARPAAPEDCARLLQRPSAVLAA